VVLVCVGSRTNSRGERERNNFDIESSFRRERFIETERERDSPSRHIVLLEFSGGIGVCW
jgi:hypothetical protein